MYATAKVQPYLWEKLYHQVLNQTDRQQLVELVSQFEQVIVDRWHELADLEEYKNECEDLASACRRLLKVKTEVLGFPSIEVPSGHSENAVAAFEGKK
jgi:hypothetical protein